LPAMVSPNPGQRRVSIMGDTTASVKQQTYRPAHLSRALREVGGIVELRVWYDGVYRRMAWHIVT
jgi:hypothetical protein